MRTALKPGRRGVKKGGSPSKGAVRLSPREESQPDTDTYSGRVAVRIRDLRKEKFGSVEAFVLKLNDLRSKAVEGRGPKHLIKALSELPADTKTLDARVRHYESRRAALPADLYPVWAHLFGMTIAEMLPAK